jgi:hypothetical protein
VRQANVLRTRSRDLQRLDDGCDGVNDDARATSAPHATRQHLPLRFGATVPERRARLRRRREPTGRRNAQTTTATAIDDALPPLAGPACQCRRAGATSPCMAARSVHRRRHLSGLMGPTSPPTVRRRRQLRQPAHHQPNTTDVAMQLCGTTATRGGALPLGLHLRACVSGCESSCYDLGSDTSAIALQLHPGRGDRNASTSFDGQVTRA